MKNLLILIIMISFMAGCTMLEKIAPSAVNQQGDIIVGSHALTPVPETATRMAGPYGQVVVGSILLVWNFIERFRRNKSQKGFLATIKALKQAGEDEATKEAFNQIKVYLKNAHEIAGVKDDVKIMLSKL